MRFEAQIVCSQEQRGYSDKSNLGFEVGVLGFFFRFPIATTVFHQKQILSRHLQPDPEIDRGHGGAPREERVKQNREKMEGRNERTS